MIEREILGCLLQDNTLIGETEIKANQFDKEAHRLIYQTMQKLAYEGKAIDKVTLLAENYEYISQLGGIDFIADLETSGNINNFETYQKQFTEGYKARESLLVAKQWVSDKNRDTSHLMSELAHIEEIGQIEEVDKNDVLKELSQLPFIDGVDAGIPSGLKSLDDITGGFQKESSYIMGARPSMGKTATALKFALSAMSNGAVPLIFSLEMSKTELLKRLIATIGQINLFLSRNPHNLHDSKKAAWTEAVGELYKLDFEIYDKPMQSIQYIRSLIRKAKRKYEDKNVIVLIDYLTLINSDDKYHSDHAKFTDISARIKAIAQEYQCPVVTLAQLSRGVEQRQDKRPMLSDLRESGSIEQDADCVMFLYRDSYYNKENPSDDLEIIIAKHRNGPTGATTVYYHKETGRMGDLQ